MLCLWKLVVFFVLVTLPGLSLGNQLPKIWLSAYAKKDSWKMVEAPEKFMTEKSFKNDFASKSGNDLVVSETTGYVVLSCEADYPVAWKFPFPKQIHYALDLEMKSLDYRIDEFSPTDASPISKRYKIVIGMIVQYTGFLNANITCESVGTQPKAHSSSHIFYGGSGTRVGQKGRTLQIFHPSSLTTKKANSQPLILPCRPSTIEGKFTLEKQINSKWTKVTQDKTWKFDPKVGLTYVGDAVGDQLFGLYRCTAQKSNGDVDSEQLVLLNVTKNDNSVFEPKSILHGSATVIKVMSNTRRYMEHRLPGMEVHCCTGVKDKPPTMWMAYCLDKIECELNKEMFLDAVRAEDRTRAAPYRNNPRNVNSTDCASSPLAGIESLVACNGENVEYGDRFIQMLNPEINSTLMKGSNMTNGKNSTTMTNVIMPFFKYENRTTADKSNNVAERMAIFVAQTTPKIEKAGKGSPKTYALEFNYVQEKLLEIVRSRRLGFFRPKETKNVEVYLKQHDTDVYKEGAELVFICVGVRHFYAMEPYLRLNWKNGTKTIVEPMAISGWREIRTLYLRNGTTSDGGGDDMVNIFGKSLVANVEMRSVDCWMPVRNSTRWDKTSKPLKITKK